MRFSWETTSLGVETNNHVGHMLKEEASVKSPITAWYSTTLLVAGPRQIPPIPTEAAVTENKAMGTENTTNALHLLKAMHLPNADTTIYAAYPNNTYILQATIARKSQALVIL